MQRRSFLKSGLALSSGLLTLPVTRVMSAHHESNKSRFKLSLAEWSLRDWIWSGKMTNLDFPRVAREAFGIHAVEYVSGFFTDQVEDKAYLRDLKNRAEGEGVRNVLIMVDMWNEGGMLASPDAARRKEAAMNHHKWVDAAKFLGCHAIRVNAHGYGDAGYADAKDWFVDGLSRLVEYGKSVDMSILVENHGGHSSNGNWLSSVMKEIDDDHCGTLPDFGNFATDREAGVFYDPLLGLAQLMPYAHGVSAKAGNFDLEGFESIIDYPRMINIVKASDFEGHIGIEWGGHIGNDTAEAGIRAIKNLLQKLIPDIA
ncbi:MAG: TIM barrel protein [Verrucomicrobiae bacterium]|nr:TIM barrel protein [Verrucomicrobiae bacterium]